jgi:hypothetical protein
VNTYGSLQPGSPAIEQALESESPLEDILGNPRGIGIGSDQGAFEFQVSGFILETSPDNLALNPGASAQVQVEILGVSEFGELVALQTGASPPDLVFSFDLTAGVPPFTSTLTITSTDSPPLQPGNFYSVPIIGAGGNITVTVNLGILVGGWKTYLPVVYSPSQD